MKLHSSCSCLLSIIAVAVCVVPNQPAHATGTLVRTFVSSMGNDSNPCTVTQPCRTFVGAYAATVSGGVITALDPAGYGPLTITNSITIDGQSWASITTPANGNGITINSNQAIFVELRGLLIQGPGSSAIFPDNNGIVLNSTNITTLRVSHCILENLDNGTSSPAVGHGILLAPSGGVLDFSITDTIASYNGGDGIYYLPPSGSPITTGIIDRVVASSENVGISFDTTHASGGGLNVAMSNSATNHNSGGVFVSNGSVPATVSIDNSTISANILIGLDVSGSAKVVIGRSVITENTTGVSTTNGLYSYQDNRIDFNGIANISGSLIDQAVQ
jgi:hypothetical protein